MPIPVQSFNFQPIQYNAQSPLLQALMQGIGAGQKIKAFPTEMELKRAQARSANAYADWMPAQYQAKLAGNQSFVESLPEWMQTALTGKAGLTALGAPSPGQLPQPSNMQQPNQPQQNPGLNIPSPNANQNPQDFIKSMVDYLNNQSGIPPTDQAGTQAGAPQTITQRRAQTAKEIEAAKTAGRQESNQWTNYLKVSNENAKNAQSQKDKINDFIDEMKKTPFYFKGAGSNIPFAGSINPHASRMDSLSTELGVGLATQLFGNKPSDQRENLAQKAKGLSRSNPDEANLLSAESLKAGTERLLQESSFLNEAKNLKIDPEDAQLAFQDYNINVPFIDKNGKPIAHNLKYSPNKVRQFLKSNMVNGKYVSPEPQEETPQELDQTNNGQSQSLSSGAKRLANTAEFPRFKSQQEVNDWFSRQPKVVQSAYLSHLKGK